MCASFFHYYTKNTLSSLLRCNIFSINNIIMKNTNLNNIKHYSSSNTFTQRYLLLKQPLLNTLNSHLIDYPTPSNLNNKWDRACLVRIVSITVTTAIILYYIASMHILYPLWDSSILFYDGINKQIHKIWMGDVPYFSGEISLIENISFFIPLQNYYMLIPKQKSMVRVNDLVKGKNEVNSISVDFINWFVGFSDGEASFGVIANKNRAAFTFSIEVHVDDIQSLEQIKKNLKVGYIMKLKKRNNVRYIVKNFDHIKNVIIPIFSKHNLCTIKALNFEKFRMAVNIKGANRARLTQEQYCAILQLKAGMNKGLDRNSLEVTDFYKNPNRILNINAYWLLGFIEAEATFGFQNLRPYFSVSQNSISKGVLDLIKHYIEKLPIVNNLPISKPLDVQSEATLTYPIVNINNCYNKNTSMCRLAVTDVDVLYFIILPFFSSLSFISRKYIDFQLWTLGLLLHKYGYFYMDLGKNLLIKITKNINNNRYSTSSGSLRIPISQVEVNNVFVTPMPFDLTLNYSHLYNVKLAIEKKGGSKGFITYVYDKGVLVNNGAFKSRKEAQRYIENTLNISMSPSTISSYMDTTKIYKNRYSFYSQPK
jgi:hypothetical protein